jgi:hypothetical protein
MKKEQYLEILKNHGVSSGTRIISRVIDLFLFVIKFIFSNFIFFFSKISLCKVTKFLYWRLDN